MMNSWMRKMVLCGCLALALPTSGVAALVLVSLNVPTVTTQTYITFDLETQAYAVGSYVPGTDFTFYTYLLGAPDYINGSSSTNRSFCFTSANVGLLGAGVTVDANLVTANPGSSFQDYAYFVPAPSAGHYFIGFQTDADIDQNPLTTGTSYGFFEINVGSLTVVGYGFESTPGSGAVTTAIPEPMVGMLALLAVGGAVVARRRRSSLR